MSKPIRQHFIPRSYLNNFGTSNDGKNFIGAKNKESEKIINVSTKDICVEKNLYTLPEVEGQNKFAIEHFYGDNIDGKFPKVYKILTDRNINDIDLETKELIISVALSLYFRTPKFLNQENRIFEELVTQAHKKSKGGDFIIEYAGEEITINPEEVEQIIKEQKENNRIKFLSQHLEAYGMFVKSKIKDAINVYHIIDDSELITSDNPVIIRPHVDPTDENFDEEKYFSQYINPFDKRNTIHLPIDSKTILTILPNLDDFPDLKIRRLEKMQFDTVMYNHDLQKYSDSWILGSVESIENHLRDQIKFDKPTPENILMLDKYKEKTIQLKELTDLIEKKGIQNKEVFEKAKYMETLDSVKEDPNFASVLKTIEIANIKEEY